MDICSIWEDWKPNYHNHKTWKEKSVLSFCLSVLQDAFFHRS